MKNFIGIIDLGTTSTRFIIFDGTLTQISCCQLEHEQITLHPGWTEHDPLEIWKNTLTCIKNAVEALTVELSTIQFQISCIGITNQRETTLVWSKSSGKPLHNAIVWNDTRTVELVEKCISTNKMNKDQLRSLTGLPISTYFSGLKLKWLIENVDAVKEALNSNDAMFGTFDSWLIYNLSNRKAHVTDVTNASRTLMMNIFTCQWDKVLLNALGIPENIILPEIMSNVDHFAICEVDPLVGIPITGCIGDQQSAMVGHECFKIGQVKNTCGTGCFLMMNTGTTAVQSKSGLLTTIGYQLGKKVGVTYALEGSVACAGSAVNWLVNNLKVASSPQDCDFIAKQVKDNGGVNFVPSFTGLFTPHWEPNAKGTITGLTLFSTNAHVVRALLEGICLQVTEVIDAMKVDSELILEKLTVDGGVSKSDFICQTQANLLDIDVIRYSNSELTARGAAICAAIGIGLLLSLEDLDKIADRSKYTGTIFKSKIDSITRATLRDQWKDAVLAAKTASSSTRSSL